MSQVEREARIRSSCEASTNTEQFHELRSEGAALKVIRIDISLPLYRMENFRTFSAQKEYVKRETKPLEFFQSGQESESVQQVQHELLAELAKQGRAASVTPVIDVLRREKQRESLLITHRGVVVNGNRRLAAMRELYAEDAGAFPEFSHVNCKVLPADVTPEEIVKIEARLQAKTETKLEYDWIGDGQLISKLLTDGMTIPLIADMLNRKKTEIQNLLHALVEADAYLRDSANAEGEYSRVKEGEQLFNDLPGLLGGKDAQLQEASRVIAWSLYDNRDQLGERLYNFNVAIGKGAAEVLDRLASELGVAVSDDAGESDDDDSFAVELDDAEGGNPYQAVIEALQDPARQEEAVESLIEVCKGVIEAEKGKKSGKAALKAISAAHSKLMEVDLSRAATDTYTTMDRQLDAILAKAEELKTRLQAYISGASNDESDAA